MNTTQTLRYCSHTSLSAGEALTGTATRVDYWFLLEYPSVFGRKAYEESGIPAEVKRHLDSALAAIPNSRLQLIKRGSLPAGAGIRFFWVVNHEEQPNLYQMTLGDYSDLLQLDLIALVKEPRESWQYDRSEPLFLVCTHGKRDACCALHGLALYQALQKRYGANDWVWESDHVGGHRFAANLVCLPHGISYGRVAPDQALGLVDAYLKREVHLENYRGRSCYARHAQAAESLLRQQTDKIGLDEYKLVEIHPQPAPAGGTGTHWIFQFVERNGGARHCLHVEQAKGQAQVLESCGDEKTATITEYHLLEYESHPPVGHPGAG